MMMNLSIVIKIYILLGLNSRKKIQETLEGHFSELSINIDNELTMNLFDNDSPFCMVRMLHLTNDIPSKMFMQHMGQKF